MGPSLSRHDANTALTCNPAGTRPGLLSIDDLARERTPLLRLTRVTPVPGPALLLKSEWYGPTGCVYDRLYPALFDEAETAGWLTPSVEILEAGSRAAVFACATVAARRCYRCTIILPVGSAGGAARAIQETGATVILTPGGESDIETALHEARRLAAAEPHWFWMPDHYANPRAIDVMTASLGAKVSDQAGLRVGALIAAIGCGAMLTGAARSLRDRDPAVRIYAVEPAECALLSHRRWGSHTIPGLAPGFVPDNLDLALLSGVIVVTEGESVAAARRLSREEGLRVGAAAGAVVAAALKLADRHPELPAIVALAEHRE